MKTTTAQVVPAVKTYNGRDDEFVNLQVDKVHATVYRSVLAIDGKPVIKKIVVDIDVPAGEELVVTLNDGDLFRGEVPE